MNKDIIEGNWKEVKGKIKQKWGKLTDNDVTQMRGNFEELQGYLQKSYGYNQEQAKEEINSFIKENKWKEGD